MPPRNGSFVTQEWLRLQSQPPKDPDIAYLRDLAGRKGLAVMLSTLVRHYALVMPDGTKVANKDGSKAFTAKELRTLLDRPPDRTS